MGDVAGSYIDIRITKMLMELVGTLMYGQCTTSDTGSYIDIRITKLPEELVDALMYEPMYGQ